MASQYIEITGSQSRMNGQLRSVIDQLQNARDNAVRLKAVFDQIATDGDFDALAKALGFSDEGTRIENAAAIYNMLGDVQGELIKSSIATFIARLG